MRSNRIQFCLFKIQHSKELQFDCKQQTNNEKEPFGLTVGVKRELYCKYIYFLIFSVQLFNNIIICMQHKYKQESEQGAKLKIKK